MAEKLTRDRVVAVEESRPKRVPLHEQVRNKMTTTQKPGFVRRFVNDIGDRIERLKLAGYRVVEEQVSVGEDNVVKQNQTLGSGARRNVGGGMQAILMEIPQELYEADQKEKQREIARKESTIIKKKKSAPDGDDGTYGEVGFEKQSR
jgi:hypothetical protein